MDAQVHILQTHKRTGAGGNEYTFHSLGLRELAAVADTLRYVSRQDETEDETREGYTRVLRLGLVRFLAITGRARQLTVEGGLSFTFGSVFNNVVNPRIFRGGQDNYH